VGWNFFYCYSITIPVELRRLVPRHPVLERVDKSGRLDHSSLLPHRRRQLHARAMVRRDGVLVRCHQDCGDRWFDVSGSPFSRNVSRAKLKLKLTLLLLVFPPAVSSESFSIVEEVPLEATSDSDVSSHPFSSSLPRS